MSIYDEVIHRVNEKRLFRLLPALPRIGHVRQMFISDEIRGLFDGPWHIPEWEARCGSLRADLDRFIEGAVIPVAEKPFKGKTSYLKRLVPDSDEVWEIRSRDPKPGIRVFGRFARKDVFVALTWAEREPLLGPSSREWRIARVACKTEWRKLFPAYEPISSGANFHDYLSNFFLV